MSEPTYVIRVARLADGDGHYQANVLRAGAGVKTIFRADRDEAIREAEAWVERDRASEPQSWEEIIVPPEPQSLRA